MRKSYDRLSPEKNYDKLQPVWQANSEGLWRLKKVATVDLTGDQSEILAKLKTAERILPFSASRLKRACHRLIETHHPKDVPPQFGNNPITEL